MPIAKTKDPADQFIQSRSKYIRILAGPGAGKSYSIRGRLEYLVKNKKVDPKNILVLTFTSIAAQDLKKDIGDLGLGNIEVSTLHSLALKILSAEKKNVRLMQKFEIKTMLRDLEPEVGKYRAKAALFKSCRGKTENAGYTDEEKALLKDMNLWLKQHNAFIMDDVIPELCKLLRGNKSARKRRSYSYVLVDEYQDLNPAEQEFVELLTADSGKLAVIGDDDQSIYEFKGADPSGIRDFDKKHAGCEDIRFTVCRRCPSTVVTLAKQLIAHNKNRTGVDYTALDGIQEGEWDVKWSATPEEEINTLCTLIKSKKAAPGYGQIVVLSPVKERGRALYDALQNARIDAAFCYRDDVFKSSTVRKNFELLTLAADPDNLASLRYLLGEGKKDCGAFVYKYIRDYDPDQRDKKGILNALKHYESMDSNNRQIRDLIKRYKQIKQDCEVIKNDPYALLEQFDPIDVQYKEILTKAIKSSWNSSGLCGIRNAVLDEVYSPESAAPSDHVRIMSLHAAKGLSAKMVIIMSAVEGLIPLNNASIEEQRRLFYVAITRCKGGKKGEYLGTLIISAFRNSEDGNKNHQLTRFVDEMKNPISRVTVV